MLNAVLPDIIDESEKIHDAAVTLYKDGIYVLSDTDIVYLDVKKNVTDKTAIISKSAVKENYIDGGLPFVFLPADTVSLPIGEYWFDVRLFVDDDNIYTIIPQSKFRIVQNITDIPNNGGGG